jgi:membrane protein
MKTPLLNTIRIFWAAALRFDADHGFLLSSGISFTILLCLIPLVLLMLAFAGTYLYSDQEVLRQIEYYAGRAAPSLDPQIVQALSNIIESRQVVGVLGIIGLLWTSTWVFSSLRSALNIMTKVEEGRSFLLGKAIDILMILIVLVFLLGSMALSSVITFLQSYGLPLHIDPILQWILKYVAPFFFTFWMFFLIYKIIPNRHIHLPTALKTALFASLLWETLKHLFSLYVLHFARFSVVYGSLSAIAVLFFWIYYSSVVLLLGGKLAFLLEKTRSLHTSS